MKVRWKLLNCTLNGISEYGNVFHIHTKVWQMLQELQFETRKSIYCKFVLRWRCSFNFWWYGKCIWAWGYLWFKQSVMMLYCLMIFPCISFTYKHYFDYNCCWIVEMTYQVCKQIFQSLSMIEDDVSIQKNFSFNLKSFTNWATAKPLTAVW